MINNINNRTNNNTSEQTNDEEMNFSTYKYTTTLNKVFSHHNQFVIHILHHTSY